MDNFEKASRLKLRFETAQGQLSVEDLWDLSLQSLDIVAKKVNAQLRNEEEESFIPTKSTKCSYNSLRLDILKHVINSKVQESEDKKNRSEKLATITRLKELAQTKADEQLASKSLEEIEKEIKALESAL